MPFVYSTATCSGTYVEYKPSSGSGHGHSEIIRQVTIKGGHGVATRNLVTPKGVVTQVTDDELEFLLKNDSFQKHVKDGFMSYDKKKVDPERKVVNMRDRDGSAPLTPKDFEVKPGEEGSERIYKNNRLSKK